LLNSSPETKSEKTLSKAEKAVCAKHKKTAEAV
jgi:hypothetical protein